MNDRERFMTHVRQTEGCWEWTGARNPKGYGIFGIQVGEPGNRATRTVLAHRFMFHQVHGDDPGYVMHTCDHPWCVNPEHLRGGTPKQNTADMMEKKRHKPYHLTQEIADRIRAEHVPHRIGGQAPSDTSVKGLARKYGVTKRTVQFILQGRRWI